VADFRDLWTQDCRYRAASPARLAADRRLEQEILNAADAVIAVSPRQAEILATLVADPADKFVTITNGFDPDDFSHVRRGPSRRDGCFVLGYVGRFDLSQTPESWFAALRRVAGLLGGDVERFRLRMAGHVNRAAQAKLQDTGLPCCFEPYLPHRVAIAAMCESDALLLCSPNGPNGDTIIPGKLFEYLAAGRPIVTVGPAGSICEQIVREAKAGVSADFSEDSIVEAILKVFSAWRSGLPLPGAAPDKLHEFSRIRLTGRLAEVFERVAPAPRRELSSSAGLLVGAGI
jgi:glycosyltransferase involved in cell wall biosynthesis